MIKTKYKIHFYIASIFHLLIFIPFIIQKFIGPDWDSYALLGTVINLYEDSLYLPSRPPGFPLYEFFLTFVYGVSKFLNLDFEILFLVSQFFFVLGNNFIILNFFEKQNSQKIFLYYIIIFSPIYLTSGLSVIDYHAGLFFGLLALYLALYVDQTYIPVSLLLAASIGIRLSNVIFAIPVLFIFYRKKERIQNLIKFTFTTGIFSMLIYFPVYLELWNSSLSNNLSSPRDMFCILNLTNTDHTLIGRLGRFVLKQFDFLGVIGTFVALIFLVKIRRKDILNNLHWFIVFLLFELSFLRLPTEEGHLLPALVAFFLLINSLEIKKSYLTVILISTFLTNFLYISFYEVDQPDQATEIFFNLQINQGLLVQDYQLRENIGQNKEFHYLNSYYSIKNVWKDGCPN